MATMESNLKIKAIQTVVPIKPTNVLQSLHLSIPQNIGPSIYKTSLHLVFYYEKSSSSSSSDKEESGSLVAGWIKESLGMALSKHPILGGRLRLKEDGDEGEMEIVSNDSGVRLIEAQFDDVSLKEFVDLKGTNKEDKESGVVFWKDIDYETNLQYSPLLYIQVTSFKCGGYSIGISSSLILIDPFSMIKFLKTWTNIHLQLISNSTKPPLFYRPNPEPIDPSLNQSIGPPSKRASNTQTTIFKIKNNHNTENIKNLVETCILEAEKNTAKKPNRSSKTVLYLKESTDDKIMIARLERQVEKPLLAFENEIISLGNLEEISFSKDCKPAVYSSWWIRVDDDEDEDEGVVMVVPSLDNKDGCAGFNIIATLPL